MNAPMLKLVAENITKHYPTRAGPLTVLRNASLSMSSGQSAAIMGPSGCGKSTLLNILGTLEPPTSGALTIADKNPTHFTEPQLAAFRNEQIGFIFQDHHLLPHCSVLENVLIPTLAEHRSDDGINRAKTLLERVGLSSRLEHLPSELSGGERQRAAIARALINKPAVVLADEPTGNLDRTSAEVVSKLLLELHKAESTILVVVTHSASLAEKFERVYELDDGKLQERRK